jgi:hypothetical protein
LLVKKEKEKKKRKEKVMTQLYVLSFSGYTEALDDSTEILVPDDDYGLYAIDILDPSLV